MSTVGRSTVYAPREAVATSQPLASAAGLEILLQGGNAIDAAVGAAAVLNVVEPHMTGVGGDMFAMLWSAEDRQLVGLDASGRAGSLLTPDALRADGHESMPASGPGSVTVPGAFSGWVALLDRYGTMPLAEVLAPAIRIAEDGFPVTPIIARQWRSQEEKLSGNAGATATYLLDWKRGPEAGEWFRNPDLARSFGTLADGGPGVFYGGELGRTIVDGLAELGGYLTLEDLTNHSVEWVDPISIDFRDYTVWELPPAGQGVAALQMMKMMEPLDLEGMGHNSAPYLHYLIEAKKLAFADLDRYIADRDHLEVSVDQLLDVAYLNGRRALIDPNRAAGQAPTGPRAYGHRDNLPLGGGLRRQHDFVHQQPFRTLRIWGGHPRHGLHATRTEAAASRWRTATPIKRRPASARSTRSSPASSRRRAPHGCRSGSWVARCSHRVTRRCSSTPSSSVWTFRRRSTQLDSDTWKVITSRSRALSAKACVRSSRRWAMRSRMKRCPEFGGAQAIRRLDRGWAARVRPQEGR